MLGLREFIHHTNGGAAYHATTTAIFHALDASIDTVEPLVTTLYGASGVGKTRILQAWSEHHRPQKQGIPIERFPVIRAELFAPERSSSARHQYSTPISCITFSSIMFALGELAKQIMPPAYTPKWYRDTQSLYTDKQFLWLFDLVARELHQLRVRAIIIDNAQLLDTVSIKALFRLRERLKGAIGLIFSAQLARNEGIDEPLGKQFEYANIDRDDFSQPIVINPITQKIFNEEVLLPLFEQLDADIEPRAEAYGALIAQAFWNTTSGNWHQINRLVRQIQRLLLQQPEATTKFITLELLEAALGQTLVGR